ncbi:MAG TPA: bifunctional YncE family protein/alkaline phosphatase family protein [Fimbriimonas sp.]|nr:bifunctional YncE family protein/alkaline phosphatase family protein [Fimbriimonas sp.]
MLLIAAAFLLGQPAQSHHPYLHMPSVDSYAKHDPYGTTILPEGRLLRPVGAVAPVSRWPHGLALDPAGNLAFVASENSGQWITNWIGGKPTISKFAAPEEERRSNSGACVFSPDGAKLFWGSGETGKVYVYDTVARKLVATVSLNVPVGETKFEDSFVSDLGVSSDGRYVYCVDETNFRLAVLDVAASKIVGSIPVGRYPVALAVHGNLVYVANIGQFQYSAVPNGDGTEPDKRGLTFPPFGYPSKEAENGVKVEGRQIPGLGSPFAEEAFSVYAIDVQDPDNPKVRFRAKSGDRIGSRKPWGAAVGGSAPSFLVADKDRLYVSNDNDDTVQALDAKTGKVLANLSLEPSPLLHGIRGVGPTGMVISPDSSRLYVAESGLNSVAVIDTASMKVVGLIPTAWYPYRVRISPDGKNLCCICFKGFGNGPKGIANGPKDPYVHMGGSFHMIPVPPDSALPAMTQTVLENNGVVDNSADRAKMASPVWSSIPGKMSDKIKYVVFIDKENHTYDTIFDHIPGANDDPKLLRWGYNQTIEAPGQPTLQHVAVMKNHNKLARQFTVSDNFYVEPEASGVGHRWLVGVQPNNWCQMVYTLGWDFKLPTTAPGRLASFGSNASMAPEDYPEEGAMWHHLARHGITFRSYGEGFEFAGVLEDDKEDNTGAREVVNIPMPKVLFDNTCREFPNFNMNIPDVYRAELFRDEVEKKYLSGKEPFPQFIDIALSNDHGASPEPKKGYPYRASWMADDDLGFGRIVEFLSHTPYWKNMAIFVTEDDAGGEDDHVDAQRSVMLIISPYAKHGYVSHRHTTITSMHRTLYEIMGLPPLNMFDAISNDFGDCFTDKPDFTPYKAEMVDRRLYDWPKSRDKKDWNYAKARLMPTVPMDDWDKNDKD